MHETCLIITHDHIKVVTWGKLIAYNMLGMSVVVNMPVVFVMFVMWKEGGAW